VELSKLHPLGLSGKILIMNPNNAFFVITQDKPSTTKLTKFTGSIELFHKTCTSGKKVNINGKKYTYCLRSSNCLKRNSEYPRNLSIPLELVFVEDWGLEKLAIARPYLVLNPEQFSLSNIEV
jgi:hypothetical protein